MILPMTTSPSKEAFFSNQGAFTYFVLRLVPDFCWSTFHELLLMAEQLDEDVKATSLAAALHRFSRSGHLDKRLSTVKARGPGGKIYDYKRRSGGQDAGDS